MHSSVKNCIYQLFFIYVLILSFVVPECASGEVFKIYGSVSDSTGKLLPKATVVLVKTRYTAQSDETGQYFLQFESGPLPRKFAISFAANGYKPVYRAFTLKETSSKVIPLNVTLKGIPVPPKPIPSNVPVADSGVVVSSPSSGPSVSSAPVAPVNKAPQVRTKRVLRYRMGLPTYVDVPLTPEEIAAEDAKLRAIALAQQGHVEKPEVVTGPPVTFEISGNVVNSRGRPVRDAEVFLGKNQEAYARTDRKGTFTLSFVVPSVRVLMARTLIIQHVDFATRNVHVKFNPQLESGITLKNITLQSYRGMLDRR